MDPFDKVKIGRKSDVIKLYALGVSPKAIWEDKKLMSKKTAYKWFGVYNRMMEALATEQLRRALILAFHEIFLDTLETL